MAELADFEEQRERLWGVAYRITGSVMDAEDAVQEAWLRWRPLPTDEVDNPQAFLTRVVSRICYDRLGSARARREVYVGPWLPEPVVADEPSPEEQVAVDESVRLALLTVLERLTPAERTAFVLHDVFAVPFPEIAGVLGRSPQAVRQSASRARRRLREEVPGRPADRAEHRRVVDAFLRAVVTGDFEGLLSVLDPGVTWRSDGGGKAMAARVPIVGAERVVGLVRAFARGYDPAGTRIAVREVNGLPGLVVVDTARAWKGVFAFTVSGGRLVEVGVIANPDKLRHVPDPGPWRGTLADECSR